MTLLTLEPAEAARFLGRYANRYGAGAFATPTRKELEAHPETLRVWGAEGGRTVAVVKQLDRPSRRADFTGTVLELPAGARVVTHLARDPGAPVPNLDEFDFITVYAEDMALAAALREARLTVYGVRITAASELLTVWSAYPGRTYQPADLATVTEVDLGVPINPAALSAELDVEGWFDDFPYYSDGSWDALSLRGYWPMEPERGIKPAEMPGEWRRTHEEDLDRVCQWTTLARIMPTVRALVEAVEWWRELERVRLLRMRGTGNGRLGRHTDITDKAAGVRDGAIARFHLPLVSDPQIMMTAWDLEGHARDFHLEPGRAYYLDARKPHAVSNPTHVDRIHLVADVVASPEVRDAITAGYEPW